jgi:hypothetical protein
VVASATFLVDSESRLKSPNQAKSMPTQTTHNHTNHDVGEEKLAQHPVGLAKNQGWQ